VRTSTEPYYWGETPRETAYEYDEFDRVVRVLLPGGLTTETTYEPGSLEQRDPLGTVVLTTLDAYGRAIEVERFLGGQSVITESTYDVLGRLVGMEDDVGNEWSWVFDSLGRLLVEDDPDAGQWTYSYDDAGRLVSQTDAKSQVTTLAYDTVGRLQTKTNTGGTVTYTYSEPRGSYL
jgi:YD repeat-containing protein